VHVAPQAGAAFTMMTIELEPGGTMTEGPTQRFLYVLEGELTLSEPGKREFHTMTADGYAYLPTDYACKLQAQTMARVVVIDKPFFPLAPEHNGALEEPWPRFLIGREPEVASIPLNGDESLQVRSLLPDSLAFDFACNTMTYEPGAGLSQVEIHYMEHGLLMLEGGGIYRLGDSWYPVAAGDFIWMAPYCPQWFGALGKAPAKYLIYKNWNR
jgi:(S)-ureidoglycine aminohydrolase